MYSKMLTQFSKRILISISNFFINLSGLTFADDISCSMLWMSPCVISSSATLYVLVLRSLDMKNFSFANFSIPVYGVTQISNLPTVLRQHDAKFQTHPSTHVKMPNLQKIDVYKFRYEISVGILIKLFFLSHKCTNK